jgi:hypothetical protein
MHCTMMRDRELIDDLAAERAGLKSEVVWVRALAAAQELAYHC